MGGMKFPFRFLRRVAERSAVLWVLPFLLVLGCASSTHYPPRHMYQYWGGDGEYSLLFPAGVQKSAAADGRVVFTGFKVPAGTNLEEKQVIVAPGKYALLRGAKAEGGISANAVYLKRAIVEEGSAGHSTLHIIYTWTNKGKSVHFDCTLRSVNVGNFDPANRPREYDRAAAMKWSESIAGSFVYWDQPPIMKSAAR